MGMFDSLMVPCPQCGEEIEYQSKAGNCSLDRFTLDDVPACIAGDVSNDIEKCKCGAKVKLIVQAIVSAQVVGRKG